MTAPVPHDHYEELVAGLALSALEPEDEQEVLHHLAACAACERELYAHRDALARLSARGDDAPPPPALWAGIGDAVEAQSPAAFAPPAVAPPAVAPPAVAPPAVAPPAGAAPAVAAPAPRGAVPLDLDAARRRRAARPRPRAAVWTSVAAGVALVVGLGSWNIALRQDRDERGATADRLAAAVRAFGTAPARTVPLTSAGGAVELMAVVQPQRVSLVVDGLAPNDAATSTYVLWGRSGTASPTALGTFDVRRDGGVQVVRDLPLPARAPEQLLVTREAGRAAPAVTTQTPVATGRTA